MRRVFILAIAISLACHVGCRQKNEAQLVDRGSMCFVVPPDYQALVQASTKTSAPLFENMGAHKHKVTTNSDKAQRYFDQGLNLIYGFNHAEAIRSFCEAARLDSNCAMAYWGIALALGPNINRPMDSTAVPDAYKAAQKALSLRAGASEKERAYIDALAERYASEHQQDRQALDLAYAAAMRKVVQRHPEDLDAATLFAESLMDLVPNAGHLVHMPSHIYLRIGRYNDASEANVRAADADESYITQCNAQGFYPALYYPHNIHFLWFASSLEGRSETSIEAANRLVKNVYREQVKDFPPLESFLPIPLFALARFGKWDDILAASKPPADFAYETAMWHYSRGLAFAGREQTEMAERELAILDSLAQTETILALEQPLYYGASLVAIAQQTLAAKVAGLRGDQAGMIAGLRRAVASQDKLPYMEPPYWYYSVRQTLGAALLSAGQAGDAEKVFREDLEKTPNNGWSLYGLQQSLETLGRKSEAEEVNRQLAHAWANADFMLSLVAL